MPTPASPHPIWASAYLWHCCWSFLPYLRFRTCTPWMKTGDWRPRRTASSPPTLNWRHRRRPGRSLWVAVLLHRPDPGTDMDSASHERGPVPAGEIRIAGGRLCGCLPFGLEELGNVPAEAFHPGHCHTVSLRRAQTGTFSFFVNYVLENDPGVTRLQASKWLGAIGFRIVHGRTSVWQCGHQPVQAGSRGRGLCGRDLALSRSSSVVANGALCD